MTRFTLNSSSQHINNDQQNGINSKDNAYIGVIRNKIKQIANTLKEIDHDKNGNVKVSVFKNLVECSDCDIDIKTLQKIIDRYRIKSTTSTTIEQIDYQKALKTLYLSMKIKINPFIKSASINNNHNQSINQLDYTNNFSVDREEKLVNESPYATIGQKKNLRNYNKNNVLRSMSVIEKNNEEGNMMVESNLSSSQGRDSFYQSLNLKKETLIKNNNCKIKDMIYSCGEYIVGDENQSQDRNYRRNTLDYPDYNKNVDPLNATTNSKHHMKSKSPKIRHLLSDGFKNNNQTHFMQQLLLNSKEEGSQLLKILKSIHLAGIDFRILNNIRILFLNKDEKESGRLNLKQFEQIFNDVTKNSWNGDSKQMLFDYITINGDSD
eukprot:403375830